MRQRRLARASSVSSERARPFCKGNLAGGLFCLVYCAGYDNNGGICDVTIEGNAPWRSQGDAFLLEKRNTVLIATLTERRRRERRLGNGAGGSV